MMIARSILVRNDAPPWLSRHVQPWTLVSGLSLCWPLAVIGLLPDQAVAQADLLKLDTPLPSLAAPVSPTPPMPIAVPSPVVPAAAPSVIPPVAAPAPSPTQSPPPQSSNPSPPIPVSDVTIDETYTIGAGDKLQINLFNVPELSGEVRVGADGQMNLPWIGVVMVNRMTLAEVKQLLTQKYQPFLKRPPLVTMTLLETRPVRVVVAGEVNRPGTYEPMAQNVALPGTFTTTANTTQGNRNLLQWPTLTQALQTAGGITQQANIRQVMVRRPLRDNRMRVTQVDLWSLIRSGNAEQDITLRDGDVIVVPQAATVDPAMAYRLGTASFSPRSVRVQVVGEVTRPGPVEIPTNSSLNQALLAAGGFENDRAQQSAVDFIRLNPDGTVDKRVIAVDLASAPNDLNNPIVRDNDVVVVQRTKSTKNTDRLKGFGGILTPLSGVFSILRSLFGG
jgi:polysaccharide biosynthesis/export protein